MASPVSMTDDAVQLRDLLVAHCSKLVADMTIRRLKTYTGQTGYVYQYYFVGKRAALEGDAEAPSTEYIFDVTPIARQLSRSASFCSRRRSQSGPTSEAAI